MALWPSKKEKIEDSTPFQRTAQVEDNQRPFKLDRRSNIPFSRQRRRP